MAWTNIPDSVLEPGKPIRSVDGIALRDNPIAIALGEAGAPRIQNPAYAEESITFNKLTAGPTQGAATRSASIGFSLTFGESSGTSFTDLIIDAPSGHPVMVMAKWDPVNLTATRWVRLSRNGAVSIDQDQKNTFQLYCPFISLNGPQTYRLEFQRPGGGTVTVGGEFCVICPIR